MALGPNGIEVRSPRCPSDTSKYGLLSAVMPISNVDPHFAVGGIQWEDFLCTPGTVSFIDDCPPASGFTKPLDSNSQFCQADPFVIVGSYQCSPVGRPAAEAFEIARQRLLKHEERQLERTLWTGIVENGSGFVNPSFAFGNNECDIEPIDVNSGGAVGPVEAIALLEDALGDTVGCGGVIHAPYSLAAYFKSLHLIELEDGGYYSPTGFRVVLGKGYPGSGPDNAAAATGEAWLFATGGLVLARGNLIQVPENIAEGMNRMVNSVELRAERQYSVGFSCTLVAVRVTL